MKLNKIKIISPKEW